MDAVLGYAGAGILWHLNVDYHHHSFTIAKSLWVLYSALSRTVYIHFVALDLHLLLLL